MDDAFLRELSRLVDALEEIAGQYWPTSDDRSYTKPVISGQGGQLFGPFRAGAVVRLTTDQAIIALSGPDSGVLATSTTGERFPAGVHRYRLRPTCKFIHVDVASGVAASSVCATTGEKGNRIGGGCD